MKRFIATEQKSSFGCDPRQDSGAGRDALVDHVLYCRWLETRINVQKFIDISKCASRVLLDGSDWPVVPWEFRREGKEAGGTDFAGTGTDQKLQVSGIRRIPAGTSGNTTVDIQWRTSLAGFAASIWGACIWIFKIS